MRRRLLPLLLLCVAGCASGKPADDPIPLPEFDNSAWPDALRLSNGTANVIVVPSIGRIMRYGLIGEPNLLWTNPNTKSPPSTRSPEKGLPWTNFGGEKVWIWPQAQWPMRLGRVWPPPIELDQIPMKARMIGSLHVRLESQPVRGYGVRAVRDIILAPRGTQLTQITRLEPAGDESPAKDLAPWSIAQVPMGKVYARLSGERAIAGLAPAPWDKTRLLSPRVVAIEPPTQGEGKIGLDADVLAWASGNVLMVQRSLLEAGEAEQFKPTERAQVFFADAARSAAKGLAPYLELEWTGPRRDGTREQLAELRVVWELYQAEKPWTDQSVAEFLAP